MNDAFATSFEMNQDTFIKKSVKALEAIPATAKDKSHKRFLLSHEESVEILAKLGIFLNGDTKQVTGLLDKIK